MAKASKYNRQDIVDKATNLYWEKGFHATSMRNIQDVIDMRPGSIYAAFGSKEGLFKEALQNYTQHAMDNLAALKMSSGSPLKGLKLFVEVAIIDSQTNAPSSMCMLTKTISELTEKNSELLAETKDLLNEIEKNFLNTFIEAQIACEVDKDKDATLLARYLVVQIMGLRNYARITNDPQVVTEMINDLFATY